VDDEQAEQLRRWAISISTDHRHEVRAAAKAILMLLDDLALARRELLEERLLTVAERIGASRQGA
jgi:hypothetical protein